MRNYRTIAAMTVAIGCIMLASSGCSQQSNSSAANTTGGTKAASGAPQLNLPANTNPVVKGSAQAQLNAMDPSMRKYLAAQYNQPQHLPGSGAAPANP
jgi:hypothetical protein